MNEEERFKQRLEAGKEVHGADAWGRSASGREAKRPSSEEGAEVSGTRPRAGLEAAVGGDGGVWTWGAGSEQGCEFGVVGTPATPGGLGQGEVTKRNEHGALRGLRRGGAPREAGRGGGGMGCRSPGKPGADQTGRREWGVIGWAEGARGSGEMRTSDFSKVTLARAVLGEPCRAKHDWSKVKGTGGGKLEAASAVLLVG